MNDARRLGSADKVIPLHRWQAQPHDAPFCPDFTFETDGGFRVERVILHASGDLPLLCTPDEWPGRRFQDVLPPRLMHMVANAAQHAVGQPQPVLIQYPLSVLGCWYHARARISVPDGCRRFVYAVQRFALCLFAAGG